ncbi:hypothetical protein Fcan01_07402 [Folsomia candida]|uniref:Uncharacterized protein n=1 Tax=Folsomia candida TaxID=158441 RepID=A0A226EKG2_FOLCA|nr:hypothetical protein Fcan01_07402 [Folsomia candida]
MKSSRLANVLSEPESCCIVLYDPVNVSGGGGVVDSLNQTHRGPNHPPETEFPGSFSQDGSIRGVGGWDDGGNNNVTNLFALRGNATTSLDRGRGGSVGDVSKSSSSHLGHIHSVDDILLQDEAEQPSSDYSSSSESLHLMQQDGGGSGQDYPPEFEDGRNNVLRRLEEKHRMRHENHRLKVISPHLHNDSSNHHFSINDTSLEGSPDSGPLGESSKNRTKLKPKTQKSLPTFSFPVKAPPTPEPETAEKLPIPFTCQRHVRVGTQKQGSNKDVYQSNNNNPDKGPMGSNHLNSKLNPGTENFDASPEASTTHSSTDDNKHGNDDQQNSLVPRNLWDNGNPRNRRNSPILPSSSSSSSPKSVSSVTTDENLKPGTGLNEQTNVFSFLHASPFPIPEDEGNRNSNNIGSSNHHQPGRRATEIQAAYYLASPFHQSNSFNVSLAKRFQVYKLGCGVKLIEWVDRISGMAFILGFCIIGFVKTCFLVILRTEIREMIEKIQVLELDNPGSPSRSDGKLKDHRLHHVSHPLLAHPHRASTVSANAYNAALPTIKSPEGPSGPNRFSKSYQMRRHSNIIGDRSSQHSQETVNMTLLVTNSDHNGRGGGPCASGGCNNPVSQSDQPKQEKGRSNPNLSNFLLLSRDDYDPISISVPNTAKYLRRSSTCSATAHTGPGGYSYLHYDPDPRPGPSSRFYHHEMATHHHLYHQHCAHGHHTTTTARPRLYTRNMSIGAVVHHPVGGGPSAIGAAMSTLRGGSSGGGESAAGSGNCSFSSRDENEILSASIENVEEVAHAPSIADEDEKDKERREAEIRDWAAATACTDLNSMDGGSATTPTAVVTVSLGDYTKAGFNHSSDSADSNGGGAGRRNGNNNVDIESLLLGTAV